MFFLSIPGLFTLSPVRFNVINQLCIIMFLILIWLDEINDVSVLDFIFYEYFNLFNCSFLLLIFFIYCMHSIWMFTSFVNEEIIYFGVSMWSINLFGFRFLNTFIEIFVFAVCDLILGLLFFNIYHILLIIETTWSSTLIIINIDIQTFCIHISFWSCIIIFINLRLYH